LALQNRSQTNPHYIMIFNQSHTNIAHCQSPTSG
jgi:hypothetical protein